MILQHIEFFIARRRPFVLFLFWVVFFPLMSGCTVYTTIKEAATDSIHNISGPDDSITKKVGMAFFESKISISRQATEENFFNYLTKDIKKECSDILLVKPGDAEYPDDLFELPKKALGQIDNFQLAKTGRNLGLNAVVTGTLISISSNLEEKGLLWFKDTHEYVKVQVAVAVYDTETGAKILDESFIHEVDVGETDFEELGTQKEINALVLKEAFEKVASDMSETVCDALESQHWKGFITAVNENAIIISSGERVGLKQGDILEVYDISNVFQGAQGQRFFVPGLKTGEVEITAVSADKAEAVVVSGDKIKPGSSVRLKN